MIFPYFIMRSWYRVKHLPLRIKSRLNGEIYFDKYDTGGAYHWGYYYEKCDPFYTECVDTLCDLLPQDSRVLDIGCGDGLIANVMTEKKSCRVVGIDVHPLAVSFARKKNRNANEFYVKSVYDIDYEYVFDVVVAFEIFEHLRRPELLLRKACEALKEKGALVISTPLSNEKKPPSRHHVKEYTREEFLGFINELFQVIDDRIVRRPDGKSDCYICLCARRQSPPPENK